MRLPPRYSDAHVLRELPGQRQHVRVQHLVRDGSSDGTDGDAPEHIRTCAGVDAMARQVLTKVHEQRRAYAAPLRTALTYSSY